MESTTIEFYDSKQLQGFVFTRDEGSTNPKKAEVYIRLDTDQMVHTRTVFSFMDWLGAIGGVGDVMILIFGFFISGYADFHAKVEILDRMYFKQDLDDVKTNSQLKN